MSGHDDRATAARVALTLGDPSGIGSELAVKLLAIPDVRAQAAVLVIGDEGEFDRAQRAAGVHVEWGQDDEFLHIALAPGSRAATVSAESGEHALACLGAALDLASSGSVDAVCFAPLNKESLRAGGNRFEDELHWFADRMHIHDFVCEINALSEVWTSRVSSHVPMRDAYQYLTAERIVAAARLLDRTMRAVGHPSPRLAVCGFNPHAGDGGLLGREEIEIIRPAVDQARSYLDVIDGPYPADTIFLRALRGDYDGVVTMFHDQGQIALKLLGFDRGVSIQGGLPVPVTTCAHGTAFDIVGQNRASVSALRRAFDMACAMATAGTSRAPSADLLGERP